MFPVTLHQRKFFFPSLLPERPQSAQEMRSSGQPVFFEPPRQKSQYPLAMTEPSAAFLAKKRKQKDETVLKINLKRSLEKRRLKEEWKI